VILLFDVMDTLVHDPFHDALPGFFGMQMNELFPLVTPKAWVEFEHGRLSEDEFMSRLFLDGRSFDHESFRDAIRGSYRWLDGIEALLIELQARDRSMHAFSNYPCWYKMIEDRLALSRYVKWTFVSCETGLRKPDPEAYRLAARTLDVQPDGCLFVDDREVNCAAARGVGMDAIRFESAEQLRRELTRRAIL
jgi:FMN hydrolase / 5-amino-6-(5-phospho-D-ribitylamino)uracil phosphatase